MEASIAMDDKFKALILLVLIAIQELLTLQAYF